MSVALATCSYQEFQPEMGTPTRISLGTPKWWKPGMLHPEAFVWEITPRNSYLRASDEVYEREYYAQLERYGVDAIRARFEQIAERVDATTLVLLCFEKLGAKKRSVTAPPKTICHRQDFGAWWEARTGEQIPELGSHVPDTPPDPPLVALW